MDGYYRWNFPISVRLALVKTDLPSANATDRQVAPGKLCGFRGMVLAMGWCLGWWAPQSGPRSFGVPISSDLTVVGLPCPGVSQMVSVGNLPCARWNRFHLFVSLGCDAMGGRSGGADSARNHLLCL